ncbi:hypothetical protein Ga0074812_103340 [Parafrankia irregularis]|uniref:DNA-binding protein n=1 Tax=Parafrankia irregularis TaxID=795642 RepID=A0A0S4QIB7_9ACTN|nr:MULTISPECIES: Zn-ribbon domain-containing OB-fold protein [Parafrankia]CUU54850.1 hypothetical protein Ga0074812_103340 [Parafrankia irregularis]
MSAPAPRILPSTEGPSGFYWTSGADGRLRLLRCEACAYLIHPPTGYCPACGGRQVAPAPVSGRGTLYSFTVNHQPWDGTGDTYVIGLVEIEEQPDVRLLTNIVGVDPAEVRIGMPLRVVFEDHSPIYIPLFTPVRP